jgi:hypothetical protein
MKTNLKSFALGASLTLGLLGVYALAVSIPNPFTAGDVISAAKMNANFDAVKTAVDALEAKVVTLDSKTASLETFKNAAPTAKGSLRAFALVSADGTVNNQFSSTGGTVTVAKTGVGRYEVTIPGINFFFSTNPAIVSAVNDGRACKTSSIGGNQLVVCFDLAGAAADSIFNTVVFNN